MTPPARSRFPLIGFFGPLLLLCVPACDRGDAPSADDDSADTTSCVTGFVLDLDLPDEFLEVYPDGCVPEACGVGPWGILEVNGTTVYVDVYADEDGDGTSEAPFTTMEAGLDAAGTSGTTVAVAAGTYLETLELNSQNSGVHLTGRCRELVVLDASSGEDDESGIGAQASMAGFEWSVSGVTVTGANYSGIMLVGGHLSVSDSIVVENRFAGILAWHQGSVLTLEAVEVQDTLPSLDGAYGKGIEILSGASLDATGGLVVGNTEAGIIALDEGTTVLLTDVEVRDTQPTANDRFGWGIFLQSGASLAATGGLVVGNNDAGIIAVNEGTTVLLTDVEVRGTHRGTYVTVAAGLTCQQGALLTASNVVVAETEGPGLFSTTDGTLSCTGCDLIDNAFAGAIVWNGSTLDLSGTTISGTRPDANGTYSITNSTLVGGAGLELTYPNGTTDVWHGDGVVAIHGVQAWDGASGLLLDGNTIEGAYRAGVFLDNSSAELTDNLFTGNATDLVWQRCLEVDEPIGMALVPIVNSCPTYNLPVAPLEFNLFLEEDEPVGVRGRDVIEPLLPLLPTSELLQSALMEPLPPIESPLHSTPGPATH